MRTATPASATDLYQLTMAVGYWQQNRQERAVFELFTRRLGQDRNYLIAAGLDAALDYLENLHFTEEEIDGLRALPVFAAVPAGFWDCLRQLRFTGSVRAVPEGTPVFANEPLLSIEAPILEAQVIETALLALINHPTSVASKASRVVRAAQGRGVLEFGARRAQGTEAALISSRAAVIGGCTGTSNVEAGLRFSIPLSGTVAHSWIMSFDDEVEAFRAYQRAFPHNAILLIDTYDTVRAARRVVESFRPGEIAGVRLDSGDLGALAKEVRAVLDGGGFASTKIVASGDLNEEKIADLLASGAPIDSFGVGTDLVVVRDNPSLGGVYKMVELKRDGHIEMKMKLSAGKATYPGEKQIWRTGGSDGRYAGDLVALASEPAPAGEVLPLLQPVMENGRRIAPSRTVTEMRQHCLDCVARLPEPLHSLTTAEKGYPVGFSRSLQGIVEEFRRRPDA